MSWITNLFRFFKNKEPTPKDYGDSLGPWPDSGVRIVEGDDGSLQLQRGYTGLYDSEISRACIHRIASECSKTSPHPVVPNARIDFIVSKRPNPYQSISQFIEQVMTITLADNNCFIVPILDGYDQVNGLWAVGPDKAHWVEINSRIYLEYQLDDGTRAVIEQEKVGQMRRMVRYRALIGEDNRPFYEGARLYDTNTERSIKLLESNKDPIRWKAKVNHTLASADQMQKIEEYLAQANKTARKTGVLISDMRFESFDAFTRPVSVMKPEDVQEMRKAAYIYWGISEKIMMNQYTEDDWNGFYQSALEPLLNQFSQVLSRLFYSESQIKRGNGIAINSDRLQYASIKSRIDVAFGAFDRGMASMNTALNILNLEPIDGPDGDERYIRGEYRSTDEKERSEEADGGNDYTKPDREFDDPDRDSTGKE